VCWRELLIRGLGETAIGNAREQTKIGQTGARYRILNCGAILGESLQTVKYRVRQADDR
jgi:hypothetical protein